eukprot:1604859-Rhodomonas_salina.1
MAFHTLIEKWMLKYGFKVIGQDSITFLLQLCQSTILLLLYVDDGICSTNDVKLYKQFLADLAKDFELSDQGRLQMQVVPWCQHQARHCQQAHQAHTGSVHQRCAGALWDDWSYASQHM